MKNTLFFFNTEAGHTVAPEPVAFLLHTSLPNLSTCIVLNLDMSDGSRYKDKVTIVTGGSRGIGLGIVEVFGM